ncbi:DUF1858 domain-containing protein [Lapidilactobacillus luobeiensis]|uniref:DUF1858 domain-containing protein n=1 Tax=Lapidilactobacillus luobeiensis TaxID=2950371 RepID=UPI0021C3D6E2|nr:DUF1858 domain-containing protein [Lapidilactobacillus luobeiensis]
MTTKTISLDRPVFDLLSEVPEVQPVMIAIGLDGVTNPLLLQTAGRFMTLRKGAKMKEIPLAQLITALHNAGFEVAEA